MDGLEAKLKTKILVWVEFLVSTGERRGPKTRPIQQTRESIGTLVLPWSDGPKLVRCPRRDWLETVPHF